jgi:hypothetical protein
MFAFERRSQPLLSRRAFLRRLAGSASIGLALIAMSLGIGMLGYHRFEGLNAIDSFLNAAMLLGGMGPVTPPQTYAGKLFAGLYALYCGLAVLAVTGITFAPVVHRMIHKFHLDPANT